MFIIVGNVEAFVFDRLVEIDDLTGAVFCSERTVGKSQAQKNTDVRIAVYP